MGIKGFTFLVGTVAAGALLSGCASHHDHEISLESDPVKTEVDRRYAEENSSHVGTWLHDRWFDMWDIINWDVSFGRGLGFNAHATEFAQAGIGWWDGTSWGERGRAFGVWDESRVHRGLGPFYWLEVERKPTYGTESIFDHEYKYMGWDIHEENGDKASDDDWTALGANVNVIAIGARAGASPIEAADFVFGLLPFGLFTPHPVFDIQGDDTYSRLADELREEKGLGR